MMKRGMIVFVVAVLVVTWLLGFLVYYMGEMLSGPAKGMVGLLMLPMLVLPLIMAYIAHRVSGALGNPFRGLTWGHTSWYFAAWLLALLGAALVLIASLGLSLVALDLEMSAFVRMTAEAAREQGTAVPEGQQGFLKITGMVTAFAAPTLGAWFGGAIGCLSTFPWFGWFARRMLVYGRSTTLWTLAVLFGLVGLTGGVAPNPLLEGYALPLKLLVMGLLAFATTPALLWIFLRTRSAVIPALAQAAYTTAFQGAQPILDVASPLLAPPTGVITALGALVIGIGLWVWKDPGGADLAVAAVAFDGTPLTPEELKTLEEHERELPGTVEPTES